jgi:hypothetical protein
MRKHALHTAFVVFIFLTGLFLGHSRALGQGAKSIDPIFGTWMMDVAKSANNRAGDHAPFPTQHVRTLAPEGGGLRNTLSNSPTSAPSYSYSDQLDGKEYPDSRAPGQDRTLTHWRLAPDLIVRLQKTNGKASEWVIYTVSSDGNAFTSISWDPARPELQDLQVFTRAR